jgi:hypothetical protein
MMDFTVNAGLFYFVILAVLAYMVYDAAKKKGSLKEAINHFRNTENGSIHGIVLAALVYPIVIAGFLAFVYFSMNKAEANVRVLDHTVLFAGLDSTWKTSPQCYAGDVNDKLTSNIGLRQHLLGFKDVDVYTQYTHHSCATNRDRYGYDAFGVGVSWTFKRK